jgi:hypothetical protein
MFELCRRKRNERNNGSMSFLSTLSTNPSSKPSSNYSIMCVGEEKFATCWHMAGVARQQGYPELCMLWFPSTYTGRQSRDDLCADLNKSAEKQGFQFTIIHNAANLAQAMVWTLSCTRYRMFEDKACKCNYENGYAQFAERMKVIMVKDNRRVVEKHGPTGINQPRKMETSRPTRKEDKCPFKINIHLNLKEDLFYLYPKKEQLTLAVVK